MKCSNMNWSRKTCLMYRSVKEENLDPCTIHFPHKGNVKLWKWKTLILLITCAYCGRENWWTLRGRIRIILDTLESGHKPLHRYWECLKTYMQIGSMFQCLPVYPSCFSIVQWSLCCIAKHLCMYACMLCCLQTYLLAERVNWNLLLSELYLLSQNRGYI